MTREKPSVTRSGFDAQEPRLRSELKGRLDAVEPIGDRPDGTDVWTGVVPIDSKLVVTELRPLVKERLGALFPLKFVRKGGYESSQEAIEDLIPQLRKWCPPDVAMGTERVPNRAVAAPVAH